jgi:cyclophilin family peptidyl-prolyl cis-trans isomerase/HEAT repeat protein
VRHWRRCSSLLLLALSASCAAVGGGARSGADDIALVRRARLLRIEDTRRDEPAYVDSLLAAPEPSTRSAAALTVGRIGARAHLEALRALGADPDSGVASTALFALGLLHDSSAAALAAGALHRAAPVALEAAWLLGEIGERGRPHIIVALADPSSDREARGALLLAAARLRPVPAAAIVPWLTSPDTALAWRAAYALARGRSAAGVRALLDVASSPAGAVREQVARGIGRGVAGDSLGERARAALLALVADSEPRVRVNAVRALAGYGPAAQPTIVATLRDRDAAVRLAAAQSLDQVMGSVSVAWADAFAADTAFVVQRAVADAAAKHGVALGGARAWRESSEWQRRAAGAELLVHGPPASAVARLLAPRNEPDGRVRAAAVGALATLADSASVRPRVRAALRNALSDPDFGVRAAALGALAAGATTDDLSAALDAHTRALRDEQNDARLAFWQLADSALARTAAIVPDSVARRLDALSRPADPLERNAASRIPRFAGWRDSTSLARPLDWYLARAREARDEPRPIASIETSGGVLELELFAADAPLTVYNFITLARRRYFDGQSFHRVVPNFVVQGGDPRGDGNGGPGYAIRDELNRRRYLRGTLGMALSGPNTGGSQFFVTHSPQPHLDGGYTVFGQMASGGPVLDRIVQGDRIVRIRIR